MKSIAILSDSDEKRCPDFRGFEGGNVQDGEHEAHRAGESVNEHDTSVHPVIQKQRQLEIHDRRAKKKITAIKVVMTRRRYNLVSSRISTTLCFFFCVSMYARLGSRHEGLRRLSPRDFLKTYFFFERRGRTSAPCSRGRASSTSCLP